MRVLRHVQRPLPPTFVNPLRREKRLAEAVSMPPLYSKVLDYAEERKPPLNTYHAGLSLSRAATNRLVQLCREAKVSIGAGCFTIVGLSMMELEEAGHPEIPESERRPFGASFPLNPRNFFGYKTPGESCMLAFSEGIVMPFLPSNLPFEKRFRLIAKQANRQLKQYQKRLKTAERNVSLESHGPGRLLANNYLWTLERVEAKIPGNNSQINPQGNYPASVSETGATCGVSSIGSTAHFFKPGVFNPNSLREGKDFVADFRKVQMGVRARDNEFLVGNNTDADGILHFGVSFDGNAISEEAVATWEEKMKSLLEGRQSRL